MIENKNRLIISNQTFSNEIDLDKYVEWDALSLINFVGCRFKEIDFLGKPINFFIFKNSEFNDLSFRKCQFGDTTFENCQITNLDLTRAELRNCRFTNCNLSASDFWTCEFFETTFSNTNLKSIIAEDVKLWKSNKWIKVQDKVNLEKSLKDMNLIISSDQDEIDNF